MRYQVWTKNPKEENWKLSATHTYSHLDYYTDLNAAFRYMEKKQKMFPLNLYEVRESV